VVAPPTKRLELLRHPHTSTSLETRGQQAMQPINRWIETRDQAPAWDAVAERLCGFLGPSWPAPPWDGDQVATLALCLEMAREGAVDR